MTKLTLGMFPDHLTAEDAIRDLESEGYSTKDISIIVRNHDGEGTTVVKGTGEQVTESVATGVTTGGLLGGLGGLLIGIGAFTLPGVGALLIGGPIAAALGLTGAAATTVSGAVTGALAGGLLGGLVGLGVPEETAQLYEESIREGGILLIVPSRNGSETQVRETMEKHDAHQVRTITIDEAVAQRYTQGTAHTL